MNDIQTTNTTTTTAPKADHLIELSVILPCFNERDNILPMIEQLEQALEGIRWEAIYVDDDSTDGTLDALRQVAQQKPHVRYIQRIGRRGLSSAVVEGILSSPAPFVAVIDADMQHDERLLPAMLERLKNNDEDIVVGSRYVDGGSFGQWDKKRIFISQFATKLAKLITKTDLSDPMSGFFMLRRETFHNAVRNLSTQGYKILLDIFASSPEPLHHHELAYEFRTRQHGESKLDSMVIWEYLMLIIDKTIGHVVPSRFIMFAFVGGLGVFVHFLCLGVLHKGLAVQFVFAQAAATMIAMTFNFFVNNILTYRDKRLKGWSQLWGLLTFYAVCSLGVVANVGVANFIFERDYMWWLAGGAGAVIGAVWNYAASSIFTWKK